MTLRRSLFAAGILAGIALFFLGKNNPVLAAGCQPLPSLIEERYQPDWLDADKREWKKADYRLRQTADLNGDGRKERIWAVSHALLDKTSGKLQWGWDDQSIWGVFIEDGATRRVTLVYLRAVQLGRVGIRMIRTPAGLGLRITEEWHTGDRNREVFLYDIRYRGLNDFSACDPKVR